MSKRTTMETVEFELAQSQCNAIREISGVEPAEVAKSICRNTRAMVVLRLRKR